MLAHAILASARQAWPPFVLVAGLLLIGKVAADDGLFEAAGARLAGARLGARTLLIALLGLVAVVTAILNLDTSVAFLTPILVHAARRRGLDERPFLYGSIFMSNAASLLLPGSNLTNLLVLRQAPQPGTAYATHMLPAWLAACSITAAFVAVAFRVEAGGERAGVTAAPFRLHTGAAATLAAAVLVVALPNPALPVLAVALAATASRRACPKLDVRALSLLFAVTVLLGVVGRVWQAPTRLLGRGVWGTASVGAAASVLINNLPAAVLLSSQPLSHPDALLFGLDLGPNLAVSGSLSALLWLRAAQTVGARASIATYSRLGVVLMPMTLAGALLVGGR